MQEIAFLRFRTLDRLMLKLAIDGKNFKQKVLVKLVRKFLEHFKNIQMTFRKISFAFTFDFGINGLYK